LKKTWFLQKVFFNVFMFLGFLYEDRTRKYYTKAHEKHPVHGKYKVSEKQEDCVKSEDEIDESHKSQLKFEYEVHLLNYIQ